MKDMLNQIIKNNKKLENKYKITNEGFNFFYFVNDVFKFSEIRESKFLGYLLDPEERHFQGKLFLKHFFKTVGLDYLIKTVELDNSSKLNWNVEIEKDNVDIFLYTSDFSHNIIIENKSHWAKDQENQIYRYWHKKIFENEKIKDKDNFEIIYITENKTKTISNQSLSRPKSFDSNLKEKICIKKIKHITFDNDVISWLDEAKKEISCENQKLIFFIEDYIKYWSHQNIYEMEKIEKNSEIFEDFNKWETFIELSKLTDNFRVFWIKKLEDKLKDKTPKEIVFIKDNDQKIDFRWKIPDSDGCFLCFESTDDLLFSIWKNGISGKEREEKLNFYSQLKHFQANIDYSVNSNYIVIIPGVRVLNSLKDYNKEKLFWMAGFRTEELANEIISFVNNTFDELEQLKN